MKATAVKLDQNDKSLLIRCLVQHERKLEAALKGESDLSYGWSLLVQEKQQVQDLKSKLGA